MEVLLVEDEAVVGLLIENRLSQLGYQVTARAFSGEEALACAKRKAPDVVIMDIGLPGALDGIETARLLKEAYNAVILFVTGYEDQETRARAEALKPAGYLPKPLEFAKVRSLLDSLGEKD